MTSYKVLAGALGGVAVSLALLSGCGGGSGGTPTSTPAQHQSTGATSPLKLSECARQHGLPNFPDPTQAPDGSWQFPPSVGNQQLPKACESIKRSMGGQGNTPKPASAADMTKLRHFAQCMRKNGLPDWPDPQNDGTFALPDRIRQGGKNITKAPLKACRQNLPAQGLTISDPGSSGQ